MYEDQIEEVEKQLGIGLPPRYIELVSNPNVFKALSSKKCGYIDPSLSMLDFVSYSEVVKKLDPNFPSDSVVMFCPTKNIKYKSKWGYLRFWIPDKKKPGILSDTIYSWDLEKGKKFKDCSVDDWISSPLEVFFGRDEKIFNCLGLALPEDESFIKCVTDLDVNHIFDKGQDEWSIVGSMNVKGKWLTPCDLGQTPDSDFTPSLKVYPGKYEVHLKLVKTDNQECKVSALRLIPEGNSIEKRYEEFNIDIDVGSVCVFDRQSLFRQVSLYEREDLGMELLDLDTNIGIITAGSSSEVLICPAGGGDGTYKVYKLTTVENGVGLEIDFDIKQP